MMMCCASSASAAASFCFWQLVPDHSAQHVHELLNGDNLYMTRMSSMIMCCLCGHWDAHHSSDARHNMVEQRRLEDVAAQQLSLHSSARSVVPTGQADCSR